MSPLIKIKSPVIVEGKYDKKTLENVIDALIIPTNGFGIFKDKEKCQMIRTLAEKFGIVVICDSDSAGNLIRAHIKNIVGESKITNVYIPQIKGKEKRKAVASKEGFLGVEGLSKQQLAEAFEKIGVIVENKKSGGKKINYLLLFRYIN